MKTKHKEAGSITINSGQPEADDRPDRIPKEKWRMLMWVKRDFAKTHIKYACRCLLEFVQDAEIMFQELGFESAEDMICNGYELDLKEIDIAMQWLRLKDPQEVETYSNGKPNIKKLSNLQKWILTRASENPDAVYDDSGNKKDNRELLMARVIHEFYKVPLKNNKIGAANNFDVDVNKQRVSTSRAFTALEKRGLVAVYQASISRWTGVKLTASGLKAVNMLSDTDTLITV